MWLLREEYEELIDFLGGYFHQDMEPLEEVWEEIVKDANKEYITLLVSEIERFLNSSLSYKEKEEFIKGNCEIYFPYINTTPLKWLIQLQKNLKGVIDAL